VLDNPFRSVLPRFTGPLIGLYRAVGLTPNGVTWLGAGLAAVAAGCVILDWRVAAVVVWWLGRLADGTDGIYARATDQESGFGAYLDIVVDMAAYSVMVVAFGLANPELHHYWIAMLCLYVLCITSALALGMQEAAAERLVRDDRGLRLGAGLAEGGETGIAYTLFLLFPAWLPALATIWVAVLATTVVARTLLAHRLLAR
jgi:phosphatidylglycerophosphate synthase